MIDYLIWIIPVVRKNGNPSPVKMLQYSGCTAGTSAFPVLALTDNIITILFGRIDKLCNMICLREICIVSQAEIRKNRQVNIM